MWFMKATRSKNKVKEPSSFDRQVLSREVQDIIQSTRTKRADLSRDFDANKAHYVEIARKNGAKHPASDAYLEYKSRLSAVSAERDHALRQAFQRHGFVYENERHKVKHAFNMKV